MTQCAAIQPSLTLEPVYVEPNNITQHMHHMQAKNLQMRKDPKQLITMNSTLSKYGLSVKYYTQVKVYFCEAKSLLVLL